jgi:hypothetical protein
VLTHQPLEDGEIPLIIHHQGSEVFQRSPKTLQGYLAASMYQANAPKQCPPFG